MPASGQAKIIVVWVLSGLLAALFVFAAVPKLIGDQRAVEGFAQFGYPQWFRLLIGLIEVGGAIGLLVPRLAFYAASALGVIMIGATYTHIAHAVPGVLTPIICLVVLAVVAYLRRPA